MKPEELRIGNWVKYRGEPAKVEQLRVNCLGIANSDVLVDYNEIEPIELTEELLLKIGFEKEKKRLYSVTYLNYDEDEDNRIQVRYAIYKSKPPSLLRIVTYNSSFETQEFCKRDVKYLHKLQNAYYLMANKELKIEL